MKRKLHTMSTPSDPKTRRVPDGVKGFRTSVARSVNGVALFLESKNNENTGAS